MANYIEQLKREAVELSADVLRHVGDAIDRLIAAGEPRGDLECWGNDGVRGVSVRGVKAFTSALVETANRLELAQTWYPPFEHLANAEPMYAVN